MIIYIDDYLWRCWMFKKIEKDFQVLADETRLRILQLIYQGEQCGCDLIHCIDVTQPTLSYHLKILSDAGYIQGVKEKNKVLYTFQKDKIEDVFNQLMRQLTSRKDCDL